MDRVEFSSARVAVEEDGPWMLLKLAPDSLQAARGFSLRARGGRYDAELKRHRERRSLDANAYLWTILDKLAAASGASRPELYRRYIRELGGNSATVCVREEEAGALRAAWEERGLGWQGENFPSAWPGYVNLVLYFGSSSYDRQLMSRLIDRTVRDCRELGIETMSPEELASLLSSWTNDKKEVQ